MSIELWHDEDGDLIRPGNLDPDDEGDHKVTYYTEDEARELFGDDGHGAACDDQYCESCSTYDASVVDKLRDRIDGIQADIETAYDYIQSARDR